MNYRDYLEKKMQDPAFKQAVEDTEGEFQAMRAVYAARKERGLSQKELSLAAHIPQKTISQIETGSSNPKVGTLAKLAKALGKNLKIEFV